MRIRNTTLTIPMVLMLIGAPLVAGKAGRWAGKGAAGGAVLGLLVGGDLGSAAEGAALGAATGAASGAISESRQKKKAEKAEVEELRRRDAARQAEQQAQPQMPPDLPQTEEEWLAAIGQDNVNALDALVDCQHDRARLLAQAGATSENTDFALVGHWLEALVAVDRRDPEAEQKLAELIELDDDVDTAQQAGLVADQAILEVRRVRDTEGLSCAR